jgi:lipid A 3-O-deacylase
VRKFFNRLGPVAATVTGLVVADLAYAADLPGRQFNQLYSNEPQRAFTDSQFDPNPVEVRGGYFATVLGPERGDSAINAELIAPKFVSIPWLPDFLIPRLHAGVTDSLSGKTSYGYVGALWRLNYTDRIFGEMSIGGAIHNGVISTNDDTGRASLGCRELYHLGASVGYRLDRHWSALITYEHMSNGTHMMSHCPRNEGLNLLGLRLGRSF